MDTVTELETPNRVQRMHFVSFGEQEKKPVKPLEKKAAVEEKHVEPSPSPPEPVRPAITEQELQNARSEGRAEGYEEGVAVVEAKINAENVKREEAIRAALESIARQVVIAAEQHTVHVATMQDTMNKTVLTIARKVAGDALKAEPYSGVESVVKECTALISGMPKVIITVSPVLAAGLRQRVDTLRPQLGGGFNGELAVEESPDMKETDCRVEWKSGFAQRDTAKLWNDIETIISRARIL